MRKKLRQRFSDALPQGELSRAFNSFDIVGDIAIIKLPKDSAVDGHFIANRIMSSHKNVKTVYATTSPCVGDFRTRKLKLLAGEAKTVTLYKEAGCVFAVDVERCYFSPRLSHERLRIAGKVTGEETVVNMFAGVGCFSVIIAKKVPSSKVFSIDLNPTAVEFMERNVRLNRIYPRVIPILGDAKDVIESRLKGKADRILMPLPEKAIEYLPNAVSALRGRGFIHLYDFEHAVGSEDPVEKTKLKVEEKLDGMGVNYHFDSSRVVRSTGPNWYQTVLDIGVIS